VTANKTTAHYSVSYANYIPVDHVSGGACFYFIGANIFATSKIYMGDAYFPNSMTMAVSPEPTWTGPR
jgi:hypothetical protein